MRFPTKPALCAVVAIAALLRVYALNFGLPCYTRPDEELVISQIAHLWYTGGAPKLYYPTLMAHIMAVFALPMFLLARHGASSHGGYGNFLFTAHVRPGMHLLGRCISAFCSLLVMIPLYRIGARIRGVSLALLTVLFWAVAHLAVREAHFGVTDQLAALATTCVLLCALDYDRAPSKRTALLFGAAVGWALAAKLVVACVPFMLVVILWKRANVKQPYRLLGLAALACVAAVVLLSPEVVMHPRLLMGVLKKQQEIDAAYAAVLPRGWVYYATFSLPYGLGVPMLLSLVLGIAWTLRTRDRGALIALALVACHYLIAGSTHCPYTRYLDPILPCICLLAAIGAYGVTRVASRIGRPAMLIVGTCWIAACIVPNVVRSVGLLQRLGAEDTRAQAVDWLRQHPGACATTYDAMLGYPETKTLSAITVHKQGEYATLDALRASGAQFLLVGSYVPGSRFLFTPDAILTALKTDPRCRKVATFSPVGSPDQLQGFRIEVQDDWYLPFFEYGRVDRPGPLVDIYAL